jgi:hypothetical protein
MHSYGQAAHHPTNANNGVKWEKLPDDQIHNKVSAGTQRANRFPLQNPMA